MLRREMPNNAFNVQDGGAERAESNFKEPLTFIGLTQKMVEAISGVINMIDVITIIPSTANLFGNVTKE